ncbi:hypothetical protein GE21DRAFT_6385 [Neurospora crassa]|uniref:Uncharacterized protein n=1 Tax=Neurospora crassa (strain ATCC 24698 / 74-OR23-1A / CBS 708.71 / DSM 1257 / FGSC 987) TaxID=367110 RepID=V5INU2_NEUCR|nr:hypothetical protein NCU16854 [Neurospora crassa OR74A]ESA43015.1 hypothetical protein NCU16854 [Neurospora crassa OR74A]KHE88726.1 hypothetical protein GE21DRAFT_6385 [Neurospora crassa]|eukprot:XP_011394427.1 hypothetical protein NCU16854 [Neurospora crassa OR74A]
MPRHSSIFPGDTPSLQELERRYRIARHDLREETERRERLERLIERRSELVSNYLEEQKERARTRADTLWQRNPSHDGSDEWVEFHKALALEAFIKRTIRALGPAMRSPPQ